MDFNEDEVLISLRNMENSDDDYQEEDDDDVGPIENGHPNIIRHSSYHQPSSKVSLPWFELRVFYVRVSKCVIKGDSTPEYLTLNHVPLNRDTLLEANGVRSSIYSDGVSTLLKRDRLDKKSEEVTFVSTDSVRMTASVKFEVLYKDVMLLSGTLELCNSNGFESKNHQMSPVWSMDCESDVVGDGFFKGHNKGMENVGSPCIEVYVAGSFSGTPVILTKTLQLSHKRKRKLLGNLESIPEYEVTTQCQMDDDSPTLTNQSRHFPDYQKEHDEILCSSYGGGMEYLGLGEDGELSWFNAGVRVGVGIGLSICLGVGIGVGLVVRTYQGTARNFTRHLL